MPISSACAASVEARSRSPAPSARAIAEATRAAHRAARHGHGQDHARKHQRHRGQRLRRRAGRYRRSPRSPRRCRRRARRRWARPATSSVRRIGPSISAFLTGGSRRRKRTLFFIDGNFGDAMSDISSPGAAPVCGAAMLGVPIIVRARAHVRLLARNRAIPPAPDAGVPCGSAFRRDISRSTRRTAACRPPSGVKCTRDVAAAAGRKALEQSLQHPGAGRVIIGDIGHQLPALLADFERACRIAPISATSSCASNSARRNAANSFAPPRPVDKRARDLVEILHADQLAGEVQEIAGILGTEQLHHHGRGGPHIFHRVVAIGFFQPRLRPARDRQAPARSAGSNSGASRWRANTRR